MAIGSSYSSKDNNNNNNSGRSQRDAAQADEQTQPNHRGSFLSSSSPRHKNDKHQHQHQQQQHQQHHHHERTDSNGTSGSGKKSVRRCYDYWSFGTSLSERSGSSSGSSSSFNSLHDSWTSQESEAVNYDNDSNSVVVVNERSLLLPSTAEQQTSTRAQSMSNPSFDIEQGSGHQGSTTSKKDNNNAAPSWKTLSYRRAVEALGVESGENKEKNSKASDSSDDWSRKRERAQERIRSHMDLTLSQCFVGIVAYLVVAVIFFSCILPTKWSITDSIYFAIVSFTTVGYGDLAPESAFGRLFTCLFALTGVACLGVALGVIGDQILQAQQAALRRAGDLSQQRALSLFSSSRSDSLSSGSRGKDGDEEIEGEVAAGGGLKSIVYEFLAVVALLLVFAWLLMDDPGIGGAAKGSDFSFDTLARLGNAAYFVIITATTVGYGEKAPKTEHGRLIAIVFIPIAVGCMGHWLSLVASYIIDSRQSVFRKEMASMELTLDDLDVMDEDGDGEVTQLEYLEFMLVAMNKVEPSTLQTMRQQFQRLDRDGNGTLSKDDLVETAKTKLPPRKSRRQLGVEGRTFETHGVSAE